MSWYCLCSALYCMCCCCNKRAFARSTAFIIFWNKKMQTISNNPITDLNSNWTLINKNKIQSADKNKNNNLFQSKNISLTQKFPTFILSLYFFLFLLILLNSVYFTQFNLIFSYPHLKLSANLMSIDLYQIFPHETNLLLSLFNEIMLLILI